MGERKGDRERGMEREREGVKFIHLKPILLKLISVLNGRDRLKTSKAGKKASFESKLFFVFSSKQKKNFWDFRLLPVVSRNISMKHFII